MLLLHFVVDVVVVLLLLLWLGGGVTGTIKMRAGWTAGGYGGVGVRVSAIIHSRW